MSFKTIFTFLFSCYSILLIGQRDSIPTSEIPGTNEQRLEDLLDESANEGDFDFNTVFENLEAYKKSPLNLNKAAEEDFRELGLLNDIQVGNILNYRDQMNGFISIYELQAIPGMDLPSIHRILPYVSLNKDVDDFQASFKEMFSNGDNEMYLRWTRNLEKEKGFLPIDGNPDSTAYLGDQNQYYLRYRHTYSNRLSVGFTAEKDRGEEFFEGSNKNGFDFYSAHLFLQDYNKRIKAIALGDFTANFGQGLILFAGFGYGKSSLVTSVRRGGRTLKKYSSVNEVNFFRGAATTIALTDQLELTALVSWRNYDGNVVINRDTLDNEIEDGSTDFTSLSLSGFHRTRSEIEDEGAIPTMTAGASLKWKTKKSHIALNGLNHQISKSFVLTPQPYNQFYFEGDHMVNASLDYSTRWRNLTFFGETGLSGNGSIATINGLLTSFHRNVNFAAVHRHYPADFQTFIGNPFGETRGGSNESGLYFGLEVLPHKNWIVSAYYDSWRHPWVRFTADAPTRGHEYRLKITYFQKRRLDSYIEIRNEVKGKNTKILDSNLDAVVDHQRFQLRLHTAYNVTKSLQWRSRIDWGFADDPINERQTGVAIYQDLLFSSINSPFSFTTRLAIYDTDGYAVRFYNYENGLLYNFRIPPYYQTGTRFYFNLRYKGIRNMTIEAHFGRWFKYYADTIGTGNTSTGKPTRSDVGMQIKYKF